MVNKRDKQNGMIPVFLIFGIVFYRLYILEVQKREKKDFKSRLAHQKRENPIRILSFLLASLRLAKIVESDALL